jgi:dienelactone hydrolase
MKIFYSFFLAGSLLMQASCSKNTNVTPQAAAPGLPAGVFTVTGDAAAVSGARWTYTETGAVNYNLEGILYKPAGNGPFPAVLINHGTGGSALSYSSNIAKQMQQWGYVCIATNYTHAATTVPCGAPGLCGEAMGEWGAGSSNLLRAMKCRQLLTSLAYVDSTKMAAFGHSRGAFVTTYIAASHPNSFKAFAHTAGGVNTGTEPSALTAEKITRPYLMHHGDIDNVVPPERDQALQTILNTRGVINTLYMYAGYSHQQISADSLMLARTRQWFDLYVK